MNRAIFLDRDNTLIHNDGDLGDPAGVKLIQGAASAIASMQGMGYRVVVVSNQGGVARGKYTVADVERTNARVAELVKSISGAAIDRFYYCPYHPEGTVEQYRREHPWRKPQPGMILQAIKDLGLDAAQCWMIGDQDRDIQAGQAAGLRTVLLRLDAGEQPPLLQGAAAAQLFTQAADQPAVMPDFVARNLIEAVRIVAQQRRPEGLDDARAAQVQQRPRPTPPAAKPAPVKAPIPAAMPIAPATSQPVAATSPSAAPPSTGLGQAPSTGAGPAAPATSEAAKVRIPVAPIAAAAPAPAQAAPSRPVISKPPAATTYAAPPAPAEPDVTARGAPGSDPVKTVLESSVREILHEMRNQRRIGMDFSLQGMIAVVLMMIAVVCFLAALWMGMDKPDIYTHWIGAAIFFELATIALLLFRR